MKKQYFLLFLFIVVGQLVSAQIVNIPDANFKNKLLGNSAIDTDGDGFLDSTLDYNNDGEIQVSEAESITVLKIGANFISSLVGIEAFTNLEELDCSGNFLTGTLEFSTIPNLKKLDCESNQLTGLNLSSNTNLEELFCKNNQILNLDVSANSNLLILNCSENAMESLAFSSSVEEISCRINSLTNIDVSSNFNLRKLDCFYNNISIIDVNQSPNLESLQIGSNNISNLNVTQNPNLELLSFPSNSISNIDVTFCPNLSSFVVYENQLTSLDVTQNPDLEFFSCYSNQITSLDVTSNPNLYRLNCNYNQITSLDVSQNGNLFLFYCAFNQLESLSLKNGDHLIQYLNFSNNPTLQFVCADENEIPAVQNFANNYGYTDCVVNSYCSFTPGGTLYTVSGEVKFDSNTNGCDINDDAFPNFSFSITNGSNTGIFTANSSGDYEIPLSDGIHTITPQLENPTYFTISPTSITVDFPTDTSPNIQDFCITPNGIYNDLEVIIIPVEAARPGFDTDYEIIYKNKGTTTLSGAVSLTFDDDFMNVFSTNPTADLQTTGSLSWNYTNLAPFETRSILYTMNLNTPTDANFPLNGDDELTYVATITPTTLDETPGDNMLTFVQTVVNSFDPNDKTCLEGETITEDKVGDFVHYLIRFENTGTASAVNVVVKDEIDAASYDINTLKVLDGSHDYITRINGQKVEFIFENINLPFDDATNDGYVLFKIKTKSTLVENDTFTNKAEIYFDYNAAIITNDEMTLVSAPLSRSEATLDVSIEAYPKPTNDILYIKGEYAIKTIELYTLQGRLLFSKALIGNQTNTNISLKTLSKGLYILKATSKKGVFTDKIIKQ
ncbi:Internalin-J [Kordia antarctica]|uniref:Internalin-J n=1 Tax=Kordia antarctica TaxID=1218801 RepID=A0A7L4ZJ90_9FLAO|nr:T9SS type A sorting domain-containing protein [Kordia antarctica]QHI35994.1 Internalin-J [Kordia antarctica]